jgi:PAS domain S-box-containing protein
VQARERALVDLRNCAPESADYYRTLIENAQDIIAVLEVDGTFRYISPSLKNVLGLKPSEMVGQNAFDTIHPDDLDAIKAEFSRVISQPGIRVQAQYRSLHEDGSYRLLESIGTNLLEDPAVKGIVIISRDVTERETARERSHEQYVTFKGVIDSIDYPIFSVDAGYRYTSFNTTHASVMKALYGTDIELGKSLLEYSTITEDRENAMRNIGRALTGERVIEEAYSGDEGLSRRYFEVLHNPIKDDVGEVIGVSISARDITERKESEEALVKSEEKYRKLFENMLEGFAYCRMVFDDAGNPVDWIYMETNIAFEVLTGLKDVNGKKVTEIIPDLKQANPELFQIYGKVASTGEPRSFEVRVEPLSSDLAIKVFSPARGYFVAVFENITERKNAEQRLQKTNVELEGYAHTVSHDLKGPISAISLATNLLAQLVKGMVVPANLEDDFEETLAILLRNVSRADALIEDLLTLAEAGQEPRETTDVDIGSVIGQVLDEKQRVIREKGISVVVEDDMGSVVASPTHMYQLFGNLLENAIVHNDSKRPSIEVTHMGDGGTGAHWYRIRDNGSGIPEQELSNVFLPFFKSTRGGTGIGLSTVEKIVKVYGGEIRAYNDGGACFEFSLKDSDAGKVL